MNNRSSWSMPISFPILDYMQFYFAVKLIKKFGYRNMPLFYTRCQSLHASSHSRWHICCKKIKIKIKIWGITHKNVLDLYRKHVWTRQAWDFPAVEGIVIGPRIGECKGVCMRHFDMNLHCCRLFLKNVSSLSTSVLPSNFKVKRNHLYLNVL